MAEVLHERIVERPAVQETSTGSGFGLILGVILLLVIFYLVYAFGLPAARTASQAPTVQVPDKIDVNVNNPAPK
jgi:hypothetical protein